MKTLFFLVTFIAAAMQISAAIIRVPADQQTIQAAINSASDGDTVLVSRGEYFENINFRGKNIVVASEYLFTNDPGDIELTIINGSQPANPDSASCVRIVSHETSAAALIGFTLTGGKGTKWIDEHGAGIYREGGGILITLASPVIRCNRIINNEAIDKTGVSSAGGGGIRIGDGNPLIEGNFIADNKGKYGAGLVLNYTGAVVRNNIFYRNTGGEDFGGGGIWIYSEAADPRIIVNNTIVGNSSTKGGGGIYIWSTTATLLNNIVYGNTGGTIHNIRVVPGSVVTAWYNDVEGGFSGTGNIDADPLLNNDFTLNSSSPCIDAGDTSSIYNDIEDANNPGNALFPSMGGLRNDIGAFGGQHALSFSGILNPVKEESESTPGTFLIYPNYPNPFNPETTITFSIPAEGFVELNIYNILGEKVGQLLSGTRRAGTYKINFNSGNLPSGIYLYEIAYNGKKDVRKMTLLK